MSGDSRFAAALDQVLELVVFLGEDMAQSLARDGLTTSRAQVVWELVHRGPSTQRTLADAMGVSARTVTGLIDGLAETGFVTREPHPSDRRATLVTFTVRGRATAERLQREQRQFSHELFAGMSREQFDGFVGGLVHVTTRLRELSAQAAAATAVATTATSTTGEDDG